MATTRSARVECTAKPSSTISLSTEVSMNSSPPTSSPFLGFPTKREKLKCSGSSRSPSCWRYVFSGSLISTPQTTRSSSSVPTSFSYIRLTQNSPVPISCFTDHPRGTAGSGGRSGRTCSSSSSRFTMRTALTETMSRAETELTFFCDTASSSALAFAAAADDVDSPVDAAGVGVVVPGSAAASVLPASVLAQRRTPGTMAAAANGREKARAMAPVRMAGSKMGWAASVATTTQ
mmetsp:Transcript_13922/g.43356  ORF Transcript_13922/g.43356 Transcript_13922/m.43356 type:complete len:234 (-) Transcript_13922:18-719(-)